MPFVTYTYEELLEYKKTAPQQAIEKVRADADEILGRKTASVVDIPITRPSGDVHDYISIGPYWWPNPDTPDGLPYINRDGQINPATRTGIAPSTTYRLIATLARAAFYVGDNGYSEYANRQMYDWFINPETKINPNAKFAQGLPGICDGRSTGLIEFAPSYILFNAIALLESVGLMDSEILAGVKAWFSEFLDWLLTDENALGADNSENNHGSWYDANVIATAEFLGREALVKKICKTAYWKRILSQITAAGEQPHELARTRAMNYTFFNLDALLVIANIAERHGFSEFWGIDKVRGHCVLKQAVDFIYPYMLNPETFPYNEIAPRNQDAIFARSLLSVHKRFPDEGYAERAKPFINDSEEYMLVPRF